MQNKSVETKSIQRQFVVLNSRLLNAMESISRVSDPGASVAMQDLKSIAEVLDRLSGGVFGHLQTDKLQLTALAHVGRIINSSLGLKRVLEEVMDSLIELMQAERGFLMLRDLNGELSFSIARGADQVNLDESAFAISQTIVQRVAKSGEPVLTTDAQGDPRFEKEHSIMAFQLRSILCAPLKLKDEVIGVIFLDNRVHVGRFQEKDLPLLTAFADQAAVAIDNARLFDDLQTANIELEAANVELETAYEATLKGWVRALDLRDRETEGHTQRVTTLTLELAKTVCKHEEDLVHITRGALLHDIGKMGIPDSILLKPGKLTFDEREQMKQHTVLAYEMLSPIDFLRPAIEIPYCHHEKWDGTGYPRGLRGTDIPFNARIFSIVDVWDALTSNRPYREAVDPNEVRQYIREQSGTHFDPQVVDAFLGLSLAA